MDKETWNTTIQKHGGDFLQSWQWGAFHEARGARVARLSDPSFVSHIIFHSLPLGREYGYIPRGPVVMDEEAAETSWHEKLDYAARPNTIFFEVDPLRALSFIPESDRFPRQPHRTLITDLTKTPDELHNAFRGMLQRNIRRADKEGIRIEQDDGIESFYALVSRTAKRHEFRIWSREYYELLWNTLAPDDMIEIWTAYTKKGVPIATNLYIRFADRAVYLFGGSDYRYRDRMAPHLLHWEAMQALQKRGVTQYDWWGVDDARWPGVSKFKRQFGGEEYTYPGPHRYIRSAGWHTLYTSMRAVRQWIGK